MECYDSLYQTGTSIEATECGVHEHDKYNNAVGSQVRAQDNGGRTIPALGGGVVMGDPVDELIKELAVKHGVAVSRDDPIMILQTINARLLDDSAKAQKAMLDGYKQELEALSSRWSSDAKEKAERVLNAALEGSGNAMRERARETAASIRAEIDSAIDRVAVSLRQARMVGILNVLASCITLLAAAVAMAAVFGAVMH